MNENIYEVVLLKDKEWSVIDGEPCRVIDFSPFGSRVDVDGKVESFNKTLPYASITIENKQLGENVIGYISHRIDFQNLWEAFRNRTISDEEEVIIFWTKKHYKSRITGLFSRIMPKLRVMVCPKGAYEFIVDPDYKPELTGVARWNAMAPITEWIPEVMD